MKIPDKIKVGYNIRHDTYSGKLGFILRLRKNGNIDGNEDVWQKWIDKGERDSGIKAPPPDIFDNEFLDGFVINKGVERGGYSTYFSYVKKSYKIRVYDPRGFEIEVDAVNLTQIISCYNIDAGGLIRGNLRYAWNGQHGLWLLPEKSYEWIKLNNFKNSTNITKSDLKIGATYLYQPSVSDKPTEVIYCGFMPVYGKFYLNSYRPKIKPVKKQHVYLEPHNCDVDKWYHSKPKSHIVRHISGYKSIKSKISNYVDENFANLYEEFIENSEYYNKATKLFFDDKNKIDNFLIDKLDRKIDNLEYRLVFYIQLDNRFFDIELYNQLDNYYYRHSNSEPLHKIIKIKIKEVTILNHYYCSKTRLDYGYGSSCKYYANSYEIPLYKFDNKINLPITNNEIDLLTIPKYDKLSVLYENNMIKEF